MAFIKIFALGCKENFWAGANILYQVYLAGVTVSCRLPPGLASDFQEYVELPVSCRVVWCQIHRSLHGKKWFDCEPCIIAPRGEIKEYLDTPTSATRPTVGKLVSVGDAVKNNDITVGRKDSIIHRKKSIGRDKSRHRAAAAGRKTKKIGT